jgi:hypothetical protein
MGSAGDIRGTLLEPFARASEIINSVKINRVVVDWMLGHIGKAAEDPANYFRDKI